jgi:hypothetical protein
MADFDNQAFMEGMNLITQAIRREQEKRLVGTECKCENPVWITVSDENDVYTSCRVCGGEKV